MRPYQIVWIVCFIALIAFVGIRFAMQEPPSRATTAPDSPQAIAGVKLGGTFTLTDQNGKQKTDKSWPGKYLLVYFGFTHCPDMCPVGLSRITEALHALPDADHQKIQPLFITVDPERDTPKIMKEYAAAFDKSLVGLTGSVKDIKHVEDLYRVYAQKDGKGDDYTVNHSGYMYLMDPAGNLVDVYPHEMTTEELTQKLKSAVSSEH